MVARSNSLVVLNEVDEDQIRTLLYRQNDYYSSTCSKSSLKSSLKSNISRPEIKWRPRIIEWFYRIVDYFEYNRDVVAISLDLLDRFHILSSEEVDGEKYQLFAMASLYVAIKMNSAASNGKVHTQRSFSLKDFAKLSRGQFAAQDLAAMELKLFKTLNWKLNPIIPTDYLVILLGLFNCYECNSFNKHSIKRGDLQYVLAILYEVARYLIEISFTSSSMHFYFDHVRVHRSPSLVCLGALCQTLDWISYHYMPHSLKNYFITRSSFLLQVDSEAIDSVKDLIKECLIPSDIMEGQVSPHMAQEELMNLHPFVLLREKNVLCLSAQEAFITSISRQNNMKKRKLPCSPTSILDNINLP